MLSQIPDILKFPPVRVFLCLDANEARLLQDDNSIDKPTKMGGKAKSESFMEQRKENHTSV